MSICIKLKDQKRNLLKKISNSLNRNQDAFASGIEELLGPSLSKDVQKLDAKNGAKWRQNPFPRYALVPPPFAVPADSMPKPVDRCGNVDVHPDLGNYVIKAFKTKALF